MGPKGNMIVCFDIRKHPSCAVLRLHNLYSVLFTAATSLHPPTYLPTILLVCFSFFSFLFLFFFSLGYIPLPCISATV